MAFDNLIPEIYIHVFSYLHVSDLRSLQLSCKSVKETIDVNEETIYRAAFYLHDFSTVSSGTFEGEGPGPGEGFKAFCRRACRAKSWAGDGPSSFKRHVATGRGVFRFKVDEQAGFIISSMTEGGIVVTDIREPYHTLWELDSTYVPPRTQIEYENGFLAFKTGSATFEIWRRATDFSPSNCSPGQIVRVSQKVASDEAYRRFGNDGTLRGHFRPWTLLRCLRLTNSRASRLVYPTFVAASDTIAVFWDIPSTRLLGGLDGLGDGDRSSRLLYVELSKRYLFVCMSPDLYVYRRPDVANEQGEKYRQGDLVFRLSGTHPCGPWLLRINEPPIQESSEYSAVLPVHHKSLDRQFHILIGCRAPVFSAVHTLPDASTVVVALDSGGCILIPDFLTMITGDSDGLRYSSMIRVAAGGYFRHLSYDTKNDRFVLALSSAVYIFKLVWKHPSEGHRGLLQNPRTGLGLDENILISRVHFPAQEPLEHLNCAQARTGLGLDENRLVSQVHLTSQEPLEHLSCIQATGKRLWLTYQVHGHGGASSDGNFQVPVQGQTDLSKQTVFSVDFEGNKRSDHPDRPFVDA